MCRPHITFGARVASAAWQDADNHWRIRLDDGREVRARLVITAIGALSAPTLPRVKGIETFRGEWFHTADWPHEPVSFEGKRVAVIGTGATGIQTIQEVAKTAAHLTVFQRTANWTAPLRNAPITEEEQRRMQSSFPDIFDKCRQSPGGFVHVPDPRSALEVSPAEREAFWEARYARPGFGLWMGNFRDVLVDREANALLSDFAARKVRERVANPAVAEKLIPRNHGFGTRRLPLETRYYEVYNQPNVELVDLRETPIDCDDADRHPHDGRRARARHDHLCDRLRCADRRIRPDRLPRTRRAQPEGAVGRRRPHLLWHPERRLSEPADGDGTDGVAGQHRAGDRVQRRLDHPPAVAHAAQGLHARGAGTRRRRRLDGSGRRGLQGLLSNEVDSWMTGVNSNVEGKTTRRLARWSGTAPEYRSRAEAVIAQGWRGLAFA
jgi:hypothetical protein